MSIVAVSDLAKSYGAELIFKGVTFRVESDERVGLVGPNGAGKSTLLLLLAGMLELDAGTISIAEGTRIGYLPQDADLVAERSLYDELLSVFARVQAWELELAGLAARLGDPAALADAAVYEHALARYAEVQEQFEHARGYTIEQRVRQVLDGLGFTRTQQSAPTAQLSGGQRTRAALGKLLLQDPELLLLDEPTNHLDLAALEWLEEYLADWNGAVIVVSHDRYFLDRVTRRTLEVSGGRVLEYPGNYSRYVALRTERLERWAKEYEAQQEYIARTEEFIRRYKAGQRSKEARGRQTLLDRLERVERPPADAALHFSFGAAIQPGETVLRTAGLVAGFDGADGVSLRIHLGDIEVRRGARIGLIGPNGTGKTTLLRTIIGELAPLDGHLALGHNVRVGYYAQVHDGLNLRASILDEIRHSSQLSDEGARTFLGRFLFFGDDVFKAVGALSGGERSRVALAKLTLEGANFLVLDEPTNHLDLPARQVLERLLIGYDGTLLFVSHDRYFVDALATGLWVLADGMIAAYTSNYAGFRARQVRQEATQVRARAASRGTSASGSGQQAARERGELTVNQRRTSEQVEAAIIAAERQIVDLEAALTAASAAADVERIAELAGKYEAERAQVKRLYEEWTEPTG